MSVPTTEPTQSTAVRVPVKLAAGTAGVQSLEFTFTLRDPNLLADATATVAVRGNADDVAASSASDDVESARTAWGTAAAPNLSPSASFERREVTPVDHRWVSRGASDLADLTLTSPRLVVSSTVPFSFTFHHRYSLFSFGSGASALYFDGGVLEISPDDGATWTDIGASAVPGYSHTLYDDSDAESPLHGRQAWSGGSPGFPGLTSVAVSLGTAYAGTTVRVRFRRGLEFTSPSNFWEIDDIAFTGITNTPFPAFVADRGRCRERTIPVGTTGGGTTVRKR